MEVQNTEYQEIILEKFRIVKVIGNWGSVKQHDINWSRGPRYITKGVAPVLEKDDFLIDVYPMIYKHYNNTFSRIAGNEYIVEGEYKKGDIIKINRQYCEIQYVVLRSPFNNIITRNYNPVSELKLVVKNLHFDSIIEYPLKFRAFKTYELSERIKANIEKDLQANIKRKEKFDKELKKILREKNQKLEPTNKKILTLTDKYVTTF